MTNQTQTLSVERSVAPLRALLDEQEATEILITSFTANLAFFSRAAAGRARARGARVTLVSDLAQTTFDPDAVRGAGQDWLDGRAWCNGAFHPKLIVATGEQQTTLLIGSGNATAAGWVDNAELWVRIDATTAACPSTVAHVADWLSQLAGSVHVSPGVEISLQAVAKSLGRLEPTHEGPRVVHNLSEPIVNSLPRRHVDELIVSAPFHDSNESALQEICDRLRPGHLTVVVQSDYHYNGPALSKLVTSLGGQVLTNPESRYHHGKLIEWAADGQRWALIGSPNCTVAALNRTPSDRDGNCELGVICRLEEGTLTPPVGEVLEPAVIATHAYIPPVEDAGRRPLLVAAMIEEAGTRLALRIDAPAELVVEWYFDGAWTDSSKRVPVGVSEHLIAGWWPQRGQPIRIPGAGGVATTPVAATQLSRLGRRTASKTELGGSGGEFIENPAFIIGLKEALARIRAESVGALRVGAKRGEQSGRSEDDSPLPGWEERAERLRVEGGERFMWFTLPYLSRKAGLWRPPSSDDPASEESTDEAAEDDPMALDRAARLAAYRARRIADLRRWCTRQLQPVELTPEEREERQRLRENGGVDPSAICSEIDVCLGAVVLAADALAAWADPDEEAQVVGAALRRLARPLADPELGPDAASVAALGLWALDRLARESKEGDVIRTSMLAIAHTLESLLAEIEETSLSDRCETLRTEEHPIPPAASEVFDLALQLGSPDPLDHALQAIMEQAPAVRTGRNFHLTETLGGDGVPRLLRLARLIESTAPFSIDADTTGFGRVVVAWDRPHLVVLLGGPQPRGSVYDLKNGLIVGTSTWNERPSSADEIARWRGAQLAPAIALNVMDRCSVHKATNWENE
jgi:hypothetical protein